MTEHYDQREARYAALQNLCVPTGLHPAEEIARLKAEALMWKDAYLNMKQFALENGLDIMAQR